MIRVLLLSRYGRQGASARLRSYQYLPYLEKRAISVTEAPLLADEYLKKLYSGHGRDRMIMLRGMWRRAQILRKNRDVDLIWINSEAFPWVPGFVERALVGSRVPYIVDYDDAIFHSYDQSPRPAVRKLLGNKIAEVMKRAAIVMVGNDYLGDYAKQAGAQRVELLPTVVDLERYPLTPLPQNPVLTIGWIGTPITAKHLASIAPALAEACAGGRARLVAVGPTDLELPGVPLERVAWSEATEVEQIQRFDVGIMPLPNEPFERGKCGYKLIQYMASGRPVIASPVGVNQKIVAESGAGILASSHAEWVQAIETLRNSADLRTISGNAGRKAVERSYALQVTAPKLESFIRAAVR